MPNVNVPRMSDEPRMPSLETITLSNVYPTFTTTTAAGTFLANIFGVPAGQTPVITPNDGRLAVAGSQAGGWFLNVGSTVSTAGSTVYTLTATGGTIVTFTAVVQNGSGTILPVLSISPTSASITTTTTAGTLIATVGNIPGGATLSINPNDGRFVVASGNQIVRGLSAVTEGSVNLIISAPGATSVTLPVTISAVTAVAPVMNFQRVNETTPLYAKNDLFSGITTKGFYIYGPPTDVRSDPMYAGQIDFIQPVTTDHDTSPNNGGMTQIYLIAGGDPRVYADWRTYAQAHAEGRFVNVTGTVPTPSQFLFQYQVGQGRQLETFLMQRVASGQWNATFQVGGGNGLPAGQLSLRATSTNGLSWTINTTPFVNVPSPEIGYQSADTHTGYMVRMANTLLPSVSYSTIAYSLLTQGSESQQGMWGTNDFNSNTWAFLGPVGGEIGRATDSTPPPGTYGPYRVGLPIAFRNTTQGVSAICNGGTSSFYTAPSTGGVFEYLISADGKSAASTMRECLARSSTSGSYAEGRTAISGLVDMGTYYWAVEVGQNLAGTASALGIVWADKTGQPEVTFTTMAPAIPSGLTARVADYKTVTSLPTGFAEVDVGTVAPVKTYGATGKQIVYDGTASPIKGAHFEFGDGFIPNNTEYVDIWIDDYRATSGNVSRQFYIGFSRANDATAGVSADGIFMSSGTSDNLIRKKTRIGGVLSSDLATVDTPGPGTGTGNYFNRDKTYGIRWFVKSGRFILLSQGMLESDNVNLAPATFLDPTQTYYPFIALVGVNVANTELIGSWGYSFKTGAAGSGRQTEPSYPNQSRPLVDLNYAQEVFVVGSQTYTSLAAFEADPRVTKDATGTLYQHMVDMSGTPGLTASTTGTVQVLHVPTAPASGTSYVAMVDDGNDGVAADDFSRLGLTLNQALVAVNQKASAAIQTVTGANNSCPNGSTQNNMWSYGTNLLATNINGSIFTGGTVNPLFRLVIGGRPDNTALKYLGTMKRVLWWPDLRSNQNALTYFGGAV